MLDWFTILAPVLLLPVVAILRFVGCGFRPREVLSVTIAPVSVDLKATQSRLFTGTPNYQDVQISWSVVPTSAAPGHITSDGNYTAPPVVTAAYSEQVVVSAFYADAPDYPATATATVNLTPRNSAVFLGFDDSEKGTWMGAFGASGYALAHTDQMTQPQPILSPPQFLLTLNTPLQIHLWADPDSQDKSLQNPAQPGQRFAYAWFDPDTMQFEFNFKDEIPHRVAVYCVDWDTLNRDQTITAFDGDTNAVLGLPQSISAYSQGTYLLWNLSGHVRLEVKHTKADGTTGGGPNGVVSGIFFD